MESTSSHSWSGVRKASPLAKKVVFPEDLLTAMRIVAMEEEQVNRVVSMLEDVSPSPECLSHSLLIGFYFNPNACGDVSGFPSSIKHLSPCCCVTRSQILRLDEYPQTQILRQLCGKHVEILELFNCLLTCLHSSTPLQPHV